MDELRKGIAIGMLFGSGGEGHGNLMTKTATENGVYRAAEEIDPETGAIFDPPKDGYSVFTVDLALDDKSVSLTTSQITGSQTAVFEYDPHSENPELEGYSLFTIDLSGVKNDVEDFQQQITTLEDKVEALEDEVEDLKVEVEQCHDCKDAVVAAIQQYVPSFTPDPTTCNIPDGVDEAYQQGKEDEAEENPPGYKFPEDDPDNPDPDRYDKIAELVGGDPLTDNDLNIIVKAVDDREPPIPVGQHNVYYGFYDSVTGAFIDRTQAFQGTIDPEHTDYVSNFRITDPTTGTYTFDWVVWSYLYNPPIYGWIHYTYTGTSQNLIGYGDPTHSYTVSKNS